MAMSPKMQEKLNAARERAKNLAKKIAGGTKGTLIAGGVGVGVAYLEPVAEDKVDALKSDEKNSGYYKGGALILGGHLIKKKQYDAGTGLAAIGGYMIGRELQRKSDDSNAATDSAPANAGALITPDAAGWSMLESRPDAGGISGSPDAGSGIVGAPQVQPRQMRVPMPAMSPYGEAAALYD